MSSWVTVFSQSPVNNGRYDGESLPEQIWRWPTETWLQTRIRYLRKRSAVKPGERGILRRR